MKTNGNEPIRILLVDDEDEARRQMRKYLDLELDGVEFREAGNGAEAFESVSEWKPMVVVSDINMPRMDGLELLKSLKDAFPKTQCVIVTGREDHAAPVKALRLGASDYLMKPLNMEELAITINRAMDKWRAEDELEWRREQLEALVEKRTEDLLKERDANKKLEAQFYQAQKMQAIGTLAGGIAHDFNNILSAILGFTEMTLDSPALGTKERKNLDHVHKAGLRAKELVMQILLFSRMEEQERKPLRISDVVDESFKLLRATLPSAIEVKRDIDHNAGFILADATQMSQIIMNLCANAGHAMREKGGVLTVSLKSVTVEQETLTNFGLMPPGSYVRIMVSDTGHGMDKATINRIFEPFFTTKKVGEGTGLGLAASHGIIMSHDGFINVTSEEGRGSTFSLYFPKIQPATESNVTDHSPAPSGKERVLFVDDEAALVDMGKLMLEGLGYQVTAVPGSREALDIFRADPWSFDLVVSDLTMPGISGVELARQILALRPDMPVIICTGFGDKLTSEGVKTLGIYDFMLKPMSLRELGGVVRNALDTHIQQEV